MKQELENKLAFTMSFFTNYQHRYMCAFWGRMLYLLKSDPNSNPIAVQLVWDKFKRI